eukprot:5478467-Heterocapsa_arctica.AAC.1
MGPHAYMTHDHPQNVALFLELHCVRHDMCQAFYALPEWLQRLIMELGSLQRNSAFDPDRDTSRILWSRVRAQCAHHQMWCPPMPHSVCNPPKAGPQRPS